MTRKKKKTGKPSSAKGTSKRLEPCAGEPASTVLRGGGSGNATSLPATKYLDRFLDPVTKAFTPELARTLVNIRAEDDEDMHDHIRELRQKADRGTLTEEEDAEYKDFVEAVDVISVLQSKARKFLFFGSHRM